MGDESTDRLRDAAALLSEEIALERSRAERLRLQMGGQAALWAQERRGLEDVVAALSAEVDALRGRTSTLEAQLASSRRPVRSRLAPLAARARKPWRRA